MSEVFVQGLEISFLGMGLTFAALGLLILTMIVLERLFRASPVSDRDAPVTTAAAAAAESEDEEIAAAIGVALAYLRAHEAGHEGLGASLEQPRSGWWMRGQATRSASQTAKR